MGRSRRHQRARDVGIEGKTPMRRCIVCGATGDRSRMVRFVVGPDDEILADVDARLPGRGFWLCADRDMINTAAARNVFARAAKASVSVPSDLADRVERVLAKRCLDRIGLARRAGELVAGFERVRAWLGNAGAKTEESVLLTAFDGRDQIQARAPGLLRIDLFSADELGSALGRERTVHAVVFGRSAARLRDDVSRLAGFRNRSVGATAGVRG
ncbi:MAG: RNA-binding protein [Rhodospirillales bacterium]|nr:RNA-binding protein [Rhodospirillales bacterium]